MQNDDLLLPANSVSLRAERGRKHHHNLFVQTTSVALTTDVKVLVYQSPV
ncbi:MAG: hypothetical protein ACJ8F3_05995 [Xanthobacteraceae bacterium]